MFCLQKKGVWKSHETKNMLLFQSGDGYWLELIGLPFFVWTVPLYLRCQKLLQPLHSNLKYLDPEAMTWLIFFFLNASNGVWTLFAEPGDALTVTLRLIKSGGIKACYTSCGWLRVTPSQRIFMLTYPFNRIMLWKKETCPSPFIPNRLKVFIPFSRRWGFGPHSSHI